ncbi:MAG TPA: hypothetical protein VGG28_19460 [Kofleriaceae bacterium]|jgi:hypothetical protein
MTDTELLAAFETGALAEFRHRDHVRVGFAILARDGDLAAAALAFRAGLRRLAGGKYHETITWAYLVLIAERMHGNHYASSEALLAAHPELLDHRGGALAQHYDVAAITASPLARTVFVLPGHP